MEIEKQKKILAIIVAPFIVLWAIVCFFGEMVSETFGDIYHASYNVLWGPKESKPPHL